MVEIYYKLPQEYSFAEIMMMYRRKEKEVYCQAKKHHQWDIKNIYKMIYDLEIFLNSCSVN